MRIEKPLVFNLAALIAVGVLSWRSPAVRAVLEDLALGVAMALFVAGFQEYQRKRFNPKDYD